MKRLLVLVPAVLLAGCIDLEGAYASCIDGGCRSTADAGFDAGLDAGADAGVDAGVDAGPLPYDGGAPCTGSTRPRLRCAAPLELSTVAGAFSGALVRVDGGYLAGWLAPTVELRGVGLDASVGTVATGASAVNSGYLALASAGSRWAAAWTNLGAGSCMDSAGTVPVTSDAGLFDELAVSIDQQGGVALAGRSHGTDRLVTAQAAGGCPTELTVLEGGPTRAINGVAVVSTVSGFRFLWTDNINAGVGSTNVFGALPDGGVDTVWAEHLSVPYSLATIASVSGETIFSAVNADEPTNGTTRLEVSLNRADLRSNGTALVVDGGAPGWWNVGTCGRGCVSSVQVASEMSGPATVRFFSDAAPLRSRGEWDAVCGLPSATSAARTSVSIAGDSAGVAVLVTTLNSVKLYFCDVPPLD